VTQKWSLFATIILCINIPASYPGLLNPALVACSTNAGKALENWSRAKMYLDVWRRSDTFKVRMSLLNLTLYRPALELPSYMSWGTAVRYF